MEREFATTATGESSATDVGLPPRRRRRRVVLGVLLVMGVPISWWVWAGMTRIPGLVPGRVTIRTDADMEIFIGERAFHTNEVTIDLADLLGQRGGEPLAIDLDPEHPRISSQVGKVNSATLMENMHKFAFAERVVAQLGGEGSQVLQCANRGFGGTGDGQSKVVRMQGESDALLRRANGQLDSVFLLEVEVASRPSYDRHILIPIRIRPKDLQSRRYKSGHRSQTRRVALSRFDWIREMLGKVEYDDVIAFTDFQAGGFTYMDRVAGRFVWTNYTEEVERDGLYRPGE